ncbi:unnamed protein product [Symbiodinium natans]|uniref:Uncharacterized protein n=1 Tax=Symbiodinium natans TaxID=878477 RepID=A0A812P435_9DINO|nr:unnamed protein product [Symbiodinium natans]
MADLVWFNGGNLWQDTSQQDVSLPEQPMRTVMVAKLEELKPAVEAHSALKWDDRLADACGCEGIVLQDLEQVDGAAQVEFPPLNIKAWLPTSMLRELTQPGKRVRACDTEQLAEAVEAHSSLKWDDRLAKLSGQEGCVVQHDKENATPAPPPKKSMAAPPQAKHPTEAVIPKPPPKFGIGAPPGLEPRGVPGPPPIQASDLDEANFPHARAVDCAKRLRLGVNVLCGQGVA